GGGPQAQDLRPAPLHPDPLPRWGGERERAAASGNAEILHMLVGVYMDAFEIKGRRFATYILPNAPVEELATGFRWLEGPVWFGDANCLLFQDLPRNRTMRWSEETGVSVYRYPTDYANGQTRDRQGRLVACSHRARCLYRTELDGAVTTLVSHHDGKRLNSPNDVVVKSDGSIWFTDPVYGISTDYEGGRQV